MVRTSHTVKRKTAATRTGIINIRATPRMRSLIDRAAASQGTTRSDFMLAAAQKEAVDTLLNQTLFQVDAATYKKFVAALDAPSLDNEKLRQLMQTKTPWE